MARQRGEKVAGILADLGVLERHIAVEIIEEGSSPDGVEDWKSRKVEIEV